MARYELNDNFQKLREKEGIVENISNYLVEISYDGQKRQGLVLYPRQRLSYSKPIYAAREVGEVAVPIVATVPYKESIMVSECEVEPETIPPVEDTIPPETIPPDTVEADTDCCCCCCCCCEYNGSEEGEGENGCYVTEEEEEEIRVTERDILEMLERHKGDD